MVLNPLYTFEMLKSIHRENRADFDEDFSIRIHRALSWLKRAEQEDENGDDDAKYIFLWISFNAAYAKHSNEMDAMSEKDRFSKFFNTALNHNKFIIYEHILDRFSNEIKGVLDNKYIFNSFWRSLETGHNTDWEIKKNKLRSDVNKAIPYEKDIIIILDALFERLYVLRNQIMHGGATWEGKINRHQVKDCTRVLENLVPIFIKIMMDSPKADWGPIAFPVIK